jgi:zinc resistance-associated protein
MRSRSIIPVIAVMALLLASSAVFAGPNAAAPYLGGGGPGWRANIPAEKAEAVKAIVDKHQAAAEELRDQLWAKKAELNALVDSGKATRKDIHELVGDITELRAKMRTDRRSMAEELSKATGQPVEMFLAGPGGPGFGPRGAGGRGPGMGFNAGWGCNGPGGRGGDRPGWSHPHMWGHGYGSNAGSCW